jgi:hypothetical protein
LVNKFKSSLFKEKRLAIPYFEEKKENSLTTSVQEKRHC